MSELLHKKEMTLKTNKHIHDAFNTCTHVLVRDLEYKYPFYSYKQTFYKQILYTAEKIQIYGHFNEPACNRFSSTQHLGKYKLRRHKKQNIY